MKGLLFTYLMTYGGSLVALFDPFKGLLIYVCFAIIMPEAMWPWSVPPGHYSRIVAIALLIGWALQGFGNWRIGRARGIVAALLCYLIWAALLATMAQDQTKAWEYIESMAKIVLPFLVGITTIHSLRQLKQLAWVILLSHGYIAYEANRSYYLDGINWIWDPGFGPMDNNSIAIALVSCVGLAFFLGLHEQSWWRKGLAFGAGLLIAHAILLSYSRGGMLALIITGLVIFFLLPKRLPHYLAFAVATALMLRLAGPQVVERFSTIFADKAQRDESAESRLVLWAACWDSMQNNPLGLGPNQWPLIVERYQFPRGKLAHTLWLQIGAELGFPGLFFLLLFYGLCLVRLWPYARERWPAPDEWHRHLARMVVASLIGFGVAAQFVSLTALEVPFYITLIGAGVLKLTSTGQGVESLPPSQVQAVAPAGPVRDGRVWGPAVAFPC